MDERCCVAALQCLEAGAVEPSPRRRVEHRAAADRRVGAQDDAIAAGGDDGVTETELRVRAVANDARRNCVRPDVHRDRGGHGRQFRQPDVQTV